MCPIRFQSLGPGGCFHHNIFSTLLTDILIIFFDTAKGYFNHSFFVLSKDILITVALLLSKDILITLSLLLSRDILITVSSLLSKDILKYYIFETAMGYFNTTVSSMLQVLILIILHSRFCESTQVFTKGEVIG